MRLGSMIVERRSWCYGPFSPFLVGLGDSCFPNLTPGVQLEADRVPPRRVPADMTRFLSIPTISILNPTPSLGIILARLLVESRCFIFHRWMSREFTPPLPPNLGFRRLPHDIRNRGIGDTRQSFRPDEFTNMDGSSDENPEIRRVGKGDTPSSIGTLSDCRDQGFHPY